MVWPGLPFRADGSPTSFLDATFIQPGCRCVVLDLLARLVDRSLMVMREQHAAARYHLLETVRRYAGERLEESDDIEAVHRRHADYFLDFAEAAEPHLFGGAGNPSWVVRVDHEVSNLRAASEWYLGEEGQGEAALRLLAAIHWYWFTRGRFMEARRELEAAMARSPDAAPRVRAKARAALAFAALWQEDHASVPAMLGDAIPILRELNDPHLLAYALIPLGWSRLGNDSSEAYTILHEAANLSRTGEPSVLTAMVLYWLGFAAEALGNGESARNALDEAIAIGRHLNHKPAIAHPLNARGRIALLQRDQVFWPDASPAQVKNSFHVTLHHLRKVLGKNEWVVFDSDRYRINPEMAVELDAALFERQLTAVLREVRAGAGSVDRLRPVLDLYRGDFLQDETFGDWHFETRDHLASLYVQGLCALGELLMRAEKWAEAATVYRRVVVKEDLHEEAHRNLMLCLARAGDRGRALRHYESLVVLLREELDAEPEEETAALFERLKQAAVV
jgi:DNA-binding SARP family transcriptional activator